MRIVDLGFHLMNEFPIIHKIYWGTVIILNLLAFITGGIEDLMITIIATVILSIPFCFIIGIAIKIKNRKIIADRNFYDRIFQDIGLISKNGTYPFYVGDDTNEYARLLTFKAVIPLSTWQSKIELLETHMNVKIIKMENAPNDKNVVYIYIETKELPTSVTFDDTKIPDRAFLNLGIDHFGYVLIDLDKAPHTFIAGETGSGKTNLIKGLIYQSLVKGYDVKLIDFKRGVSFVAFTDAITIYSDYDRIILLLESLVKETHNRLDLLRNNRVEDIKQYNELPDCYMERTVLFIDELAELMKSSDKVGNKRITDALETLTRLSRAVGINLIMGLQRPDATIINGQIKNNVSRRITGRFSDPEPSRIMLGNDLAMRLPNIRGRMLLKDDETREFQAFYVPQESLNLERFKKVNTYSQPIEVPKTEEHREPKGIDFNFDDII